MPVWFLVVVIGIGIALLAGAISKAIWHNCRLVAQLHKARANGWKLAKEDVDIDKDYEQWSPKVKKWFKETEALLQRNWPSKLPEFLPDPLPLDSGTLSINLERMLLERLKKLEEIIKPLTISN